MPRVSSAPMPYKVTSRHPLVPLESAHRIPGCSWQTPNAHSPRRLYPSRERGSWNLSNIISWIASKGECVKDIGSKARAKLKESVKAQLRFDRMGDVVDDLFGELEDKSADELTLAFQKDMQQELRKELAKSNREQLELAEKKDEKHEDQLDEDLKSAIEDAILDDEGGIDLSDWLASEKTKPYMDPGSLSEMEILDQILDLLKQEQKKTFAKNSVENANLLFEMNCVKT